MQDPIASESRSRTFIAVIGGSKCTEAIASLAYEVGRRLAENDAVLVCGGLSGVMEASCHGAYDAGGTTVGILPGDNPKDANPYVSIPVATGIGFARNRLVVLNAHSVIAIDGAYGTLSEIGFALSMGKPVVGLATWELSQASELDKSIHRVGSPNEAVNLALKLASGNYNQTIIH